jgi:membrane protein DedA with SNARE-associated domain
MLVAALGAILGDTTGYALSKRLGPQLLAREDS